MSRSGNPRSKGASRLPRQALHSESKGRESGARKKARASAAGRFVRIGRSRPVLRAVIVFAVLIGLFYGLVHTPRTEGDIFQPYLGLIATVTGSIVNLFGYETNVVDTSIASPAFSMQIVRGCDAIEPAAAFAAAVLASPVALWTKLPGILAGMLILLLVNLVRLVSLFFIGVHWPSALDVMHEDVWQAAFIVLAIVLWAIWVQWATKDKAGEPHASG